MYELVVLGFWKVNGSGYIKERNYSLRYDKFRGVFFVVFFVIVFFS